MRLLITTQAVDLNDPVLGFFHRWIEEIAHGCEHVHVICLKEGIHQLPANVTVHSLGKEVSRSRVKYILRFYRYMYTLRGDYDAVFVHMNAEYVVLGGIFWRQWGKRIVLWRNHKMAGLSTRIAAHLAHVVCYTSPSAYVARFGNAVQMPIGIDTDLFSPPPSDREPMQNSILFFGRLDEVKHPDTFLEAIQSLSETNVATQVDVIGDPTPGRETYARDLKGRFGRLKNVSFQDAVANSKAPDAYRSHAIYVNLTPSGSFDKTIGEAAASGCMVIAGNEVLRGIVPDALLVDPFSADSVAGGINVALKLLTDERAALSKKLRDYVVREHSLTLLVEKLTSVLHHS